MGEPRRLFDPDSYRVVPGWQSRLRELAALPVSPARTGREARDEAGRAAVDRLRRIGAELAAWFGLGYASIEAEQDGVNSHYGICYQDGVIRVRLRHAVSGRLLKESSLVDTLCHELAHLRYFDHSPRFHRLYREILEEARKRGFYRPGPPRGARSRQRSLFDGPASNASTRVAQRGDLR